MCTINVQAKTIRFKYKFKIASAEGAGIVQVGDKEIGAYVSLY